MSYQTGSGAAHEGPSVGIARWEKAFFLLVGLSAGWIGFWGYFLPAIQKSIPFAIPPMHSRFLGAMYLSAFVMLMCGFLGRSWSEVAVVPVITLVWTGGIFAVSMLHTDLFDFSTPQTWIWFVAYGAYPLIALWIVWNRRTEILSAGPDGGAPGWVRVYLLAQGALLLVVAALLLAVPARMVGLWPWPITRALAQLYSAPFLAYALGSLVIGRWRQWSRLRIGLVTIAGFAAGVLVASWIHRSLFSANELPDQLWFGFFTLATVILSALSVRAVRHS